MDTDADAFSIDIGDSNNQLAFALDRNTEIIASVFLKDAKGSFVPMFTGIADVCGKASDDMLFSIQGRDLSSLALGDAPPGRWRHVRPKHFIQQRAQKLGLVNTVIHAMSEVGTVYTDGSESEWALWYRLARMKGMWMWTEPNGQLVIDKLNYSLATSYRFGRPPQGQPSLGWVPVKRIHIVTSSSGRQGEVWVYGEDAKSQIPVVGRSVDGSIKSWRRKPLKIITDGKVKSQRDAKKEADLVLFESIVGATELEVTIRDEGVLVRQNRMAQINLPELDLKGNYFIVGVRSEGSEDGMQQIIRLREKSYALSRRVPDAPKLDDKDDSGAKVPASIADALAQAGGGAGVRWADSFVRATREFGVQAGWDFAVFLGVLLSICQHESSFQNVRGIVDGAINRVEWYPRPGSPEAAIIAGGKAIAEAVASVLKGGNPVDSADTAHTNREPNLAGQVERWRRTFANERTNPLNPRGRSSNTAVGPMQLVSDHYRVWADSYGWSGAKHTGESEYEGGRWNPDSNIRAAARALVEKLNVAPKADPGVPNSIWIGVARYFGSGDAGTEAKYVKAVKANYDNLFGGLAKGAITAAQTLPKGTQTKVNVAGYGTLEIPVVTPNSIKKAINFCLKRLGDPYKWSGSGPFYDCSSFVTAAYASAGAEFRAMLDEARPGHHGDTTYTLYRAGRFKAVARDKLLPGDLVFFRGSVPEHMGMYLWDGLFIASSNSSAPPKGGVKINGIGEPYYRDTYTGARRLVDWTYNEPTAQDERNR